MTETQEARLVFSWDTTSVENATKRIEQHFGRIDAAEKKQAAAGKATKEKAAAEEKKGGHGGHGGGNIGMGIHDALMGRTGAALFRFTAAARLASGVASAVAIGLEVAGKSFAYATGEIEKTDQAASRLEQSFLKVAKAATFSSAGDGVGKISGNKEGLLDQIRGERDQQNDLQNFQELKSDKAVKILGVPLADGGIYAAYDSLRSKLTGAETTEQKIAGSDLRERVAGQQLGKLNAQTAQAYSDDVEVAYGRSRFGDKFTGQRLELSRKQDAEEAKAGADPTTGAANIAAIREKYRLEMDGINQAEKASQRQLDAEQAITRARREGGSVELHTAQIRLAAAGAALGQAVPGTKEFQEKNTAYDAALVEVGTATRDRKMSRADARIRQQMAGVGSSEGEDARALRNADLEVRQAEKRLRLLQDLKDVKASEQELNEANLALVTAQTNQEMVRRREAEARLQLENNVTRAPRDIRAAGALLGGASPEEAETQALTARVDAAKDAYDLAVKRAAIEHNSKESLEAQAAAAKDVAQAEISLAEHKQQIRRQRAMELESAQGETASLRFAASGRDDLAEVTGQRAQSRVSIERANLSGHPEIAGELAEQQRLRERRSVEDLYLNPDGTRRKPADVQRELFQRRQRQTRVDQFNKAMDRNGGLLHVQRDIGGRITGGTDPLTGELLNSRQIASRNAAAHARVDTAKDDRSDREIQQSIFTVLDARLPKITK